MTKLGFLRGSRRPVYSPPTEDRSCDAVAGANVSCQVRHRDHPGALRALDFRLDRTLRATGRCCPPPLGVRPPQRLAPLRPCLGTLSLAGQRGADLRPDLRGALIRHLSFQVMAHVAAHVCRGEVRRVVVCVVTVPVMDGSTVRSPAPLKEPLAAERAEMWRWPVYRLEHGPVMAGLMNHTDHLSAVVPLSRCSDG